MEQTVRLSLAVTPSRGSRRRARRRRCVHPRRWRRLPERMKGSKRRTRVHSGSETGGGVLGGVLVAGVAELAPHGGHHGVGVGGVVVHVHPLAAFHPRRARRGRGIREETDASGTRARGEEARMAVHQRHDRSRALVHVPGAREVPGVERQLGQSLRLALREGLHGDALVPADRRMRSTGDDRATGWLPTDDGPGLARAALCPGTGGEMPVSPNRRSWSWSVGD